jgi:hypothetical protein
MEIELLMDARNAVMFSLILASGTLFPEAPLKISHAVQARWKRLQAAVRSFRSGKKNRLPGSFWEIDMTKFAP